MKLFSRLGEIRKRKVSSIGTVTIGSKFKGQDVFILDNLDGTLTIVTKEVANASQNGPTSTCSGCSK